VPSIPAKTADPGAGWSRLDRNRAEGFGDFGQTAAGHLEHADFVRRAEAVLHRAQDAELVAALALEIKDGIDHVFDDAGAGDLAVLGDMADQDHRHAAPLGEGHQLMRAARTCATEPGAASTCRPHGLDRIDDRKGGAFGVQRGQDVAQVGFGAKLDGASVRPRRWARIRTCALASSPEIYRHFSPLRAKLAAACNKSVDLPMPGSPPTRIAEAGTSPPPSTRSKFVNAGGGAGRRGFFGRKVGQRDRPTLGPQRLRAGRERRLFDDGVPAAAGIAFARPICDGGAAGVQVKAGGLFHGGESLPGKGQHQG
jgi:hypothetical protein